MKESADRPLQGSPVYDQDATNYSEEGVARMFMILGRVHIRCVCGFLSRFLADSGQKFVDVLVCLNTFWRRI